MGARNVSAVFAMWADLAPLPKVVLLWMALQSLDPPGGKDGRPPRLYFDGEESLVQSSGRSRSQVYTAIKTLRDRGAIEVIEAGRMKHRAVYKLRLDPLAKDRPVSGNPDATGSGKPDPLGSGNPDMQGPGNRTPRSNEGGTEESRGGNTSPAQPSHLRLVPPVDNPEAMTYEQASALLTKTWGPERAGTAAADHVEAHGGTLAAAVIHLAHQIGGKTA